VRAVDEMRTVIESGIARLQTNRDRALGCFRDPDLRDTTSCSVP